MISDSLKYIICVNKVGLYRILCKNYVQKHLFLFSSLQHHMMKPKGVAIAALAQYGVMPLTAFCLAKVGITLSSGG